jgi:hypothetical protein
MRLEGRIARFSPDDRPEEDRKRRTGIDFGPNPVETGDFRDVETSSKQSGSNVR